MKISTRSSSSSGFTLVEIMIVVAIIGLLLGIAIPSFMKARTQARQQLCIENLMQIETAKQLWGLENNKKEGDVAVESDLIGALLFIKVMPQCPGAGAYTFQPIGTTATCSIPGHTL